MMNLVVALAAFVLTHFALSHPLRAPLVARLGEKGFLGLYSLLAFATLAARVVLTGNTAVVIASESAPLPAAAFSEIIATSDVPGGVINVLTGRRDDLIPTLASHMDVNAIVDASRIPKVAGALRAGTASNLKRIFHDPCANLSDWFDDARAADPYRILETAEIKTAWHPVKA